MLWMLSAVLVLPACSSRDDTEPIELPGEPPGVRHLDDAALAAQLDTVQEGLREVTDTAVAWRGL